MEFNKFRNYKSKFNSNLLILSACNTASPDQVVIIIQELDRFFYMNQANKINDSELFSELIATEFFKNNAKNFLKN